MTVKILSTQQKINKYSKKDYTHSTHSINESQQQLKWLFFSKSVKLSIDTACASKVYGRPVARKQEHRKTEGQMYVVLLRTP